MKTVRYLIITKPGADFPILVGQNVISIDPCDLPDEIYVTIPESAAAAFEQHLNGCPSVVSYREVKEENDPPEHRLPGPFSPPEGGKNDTRV
jgi:hypothetical protein